MIALAELILLFLLAAAAGGTLLSILRLQPESAAQRLVYGASVGLGLIAYSILTLGLLGLYRPQWILGTLALIAIASFRGWSGLYLDVIRRRPLPDNPDSSSNGRSFPKAPNWIAVAGALLLAVTAVIVLINCFVPPATDEWDALSYHLAAPKAYLQAGRIVYLPTDHHSNFPFTMQMLFLVALTVNGFPLANLIHFGTAALTVATVLLIARDRMPPAVGWAGAAVFVTCPMAVWQAGAAYVEIGFALFVVTAVGALVEFRAAADRKWLRLCAILIGLALSVKTLALIPLALIVAALLWFRVPFKRLVTFVAVAVAVGSPFYVKSWIVTGNPVYPFGYRLFGGRDWSPELAETYASEHRSFGQSAQRASVREEVEGVSLRHQAPSAGERLLNLLQAPFDLVAVPRIFHNFNNPGIHAHLGFLVIALPMLLLFARPRSHTARLLSAFCGLWFLAWSQSMQYARYLLPMVPLLGLPAGEGVVRLARVSRLIAALAAAAFALQAGLTLTHFGSLVPYRLAVAMSAEKREAYLTSKVNVYSSQQWINRNSALTDGVVLFEETRGFYLDRPYLWGNGPHSLYIPYHEFENGQAMAKWFLEKGYRYAILNLQFSPFGQSEERYREAAMASAAGTQAGLIRNWYADSARMEEIRSRYNGRGSPEYAPNRHRDVYWRLLLGDAVVNGGAVVRTDASSRAAVVLEFRPG